MHRILTLAAALLAVTMLAVGATSAPAAQKPSAGKPLAARLAAKAKRLGAAAEYLVLSRDELRARLRAGDSLAEVAEAQGKTVDGLVDAMLAPLAMRLDKAVAADRVTRERADRLLERLERRIERRIARAKTSG